MPAEFTKSLTIDLMPFFESQKVKVVNHMKRNYIENVHYIIIASCNNPEKIKNHGGHNKIDYMLTDESFELLKNTFNMRNRYIVDVSANVKMVSPIAMCIESQTIGFIENAFKDVIETRRQYRIGTYKIDLYFPTYCLAIECDENGHSDRDPYYEAAREKYIIDAGNTMIRFNPNEPGFDLSFVLRKINKVILHA